MEVRKGKRLRLKARVEVILAERHLRTKTEGMLHDLAPGGCAFYHRTPMPVGQRVQLRIELDDALKEKLGKTHLTAVGAVIRSIPDSKRFLISLRFLPVRKKV
jgi:hypothetical protein